MKGFIDRIFGRKEKVPECKGSNLKDCMRCSYLAAYCREIYVDIDGNKIVTIGCRVKGSKKFNEVTGKLIEENKRV